MRNATAPGRRNSSLRRSSTTPLLNAARRGSGQRNGSSASGLLQAPQNATAPTDGGGSRSSSKTRLCEICSICLEPLADSSCFVFPCGFNHRLHYRCAIIFLLSSLKPLLDNGDASPSQAKRRTSALSLGDGFRAIAAIGERLASVAPELLHRVCCPLCRGAWPSLESVPVETLMDQLRALRTQKLGDAATKMERALQRGKDHFDDGADVNRTRLVKGLLRFGDNYHSAATFLSHCAADCNCATSILSCLHVNSIRYLSCVTCKINAFCVRSYKLRVPHLRIEKLRTAVHHVCPDDLVSLEAVTPSNIASMSALEVLTCTKWLSSNAQLQVLVLSGMQWEKIDPECKYLINGLMNKNLQILDLSNNDLVDTSVENLGRALANHDELQTLTLCNNRVTSKGFASILPFANHTISNKNKGRGIQDWGFRHNNLGDEGCKLIAESCPYVDSYTRAPSKTNGKEAVSNWDLRTNGITEVGCKLLAALVGSMVVARLGCNSIGDAGALYLSARFGNSLLTLDLRQAKIGDDGAIAMADRLINCTCLRELLLSGNEIGTFGVRRLADGWAWVSELQLVDLSSNPLGCEGVAALAEELPCWQQTPFRLLLASVDCGPHGADELKRALIKNNRRGWGWTIDLTCNDVDPVVTVGIRGLLEPLLPSEDMREIEAMPCLGSPTSMRPY